MLEFYLFGMLITAVFVIAAYQAEMYQLEQHLRKTRNYHGSHRVKKDAKGRLAANFFGALIWPVFLLRLLFEQLDKK